MTLTLLLSNLSIYKETHLFYLENEDMALPAQESSLR